MTISELGIANIANYFSLGWNKKEVDGFIFDDIFQIEGIPYSWFLNRLLSLHTLPPQLKVKTKIEKMLCKESFTYTHKDKIRNAMLARLFAWNERAKINGAKDQQIPPGDILFLTYVEHIHSQTGEIYRLQGVLDALQQKDIQKPLIICASPQSELFSTFMQHRSKASDAFLLYNAITPHLKEKAKAISAKLAARWKNLDEIKKVTMFDSVDIWNCLRGAFDFYCSESFLYIVILYYETCKSIIERSGIKVVVITSQNSIFERCLNAAAHHDNIKTVLLQHGAAMGSINPELLSPYKIAVFSKVYKNSLVKQKVSARNIAVVGPLIFDEIYPFLNPKKKIDHKSILILTVPFIEQGIFSKEEYFSYIDKIILQALACGQEITLKLHPRERYLKEYESLIQRQGYQKVTVLQNDQRKVLYELMNQSDIIINFSSTVAVEAMILDKALITITFARFQNPFNEVIHASQASLEVDVNENLTAAIEKIRDDTVLQKKLQHKRRAFVKEYCGKVNGKATQKVVMMLEKMI